MLTAAGMMMHAHRSRSSVLSLSLEREPAVGAAPAMVALPEDFDPGRYRRSHRDVAQSGADPAEHWRTLGLAEERAGLRPNWRYPRFQTAYYLLNNPDVVGLIQGGVVDSAADHWFCFGRDEYRRGERPLGQDFDEAGYLDRRRDIASAVRRGGYASGFDHWLCWGRGEDEDAATPVLRIPRTRPSTEALSQEQQTFWKENGYVILPGAISAERCDEASRRIDAIWATRATANLPFCIDVKLETPEQRRIPMAAAPDEAKAAPYKINDSFMADDFFADIALDPEVTKVLKWVLEADPCVVASLNFERGSTQDFHTDTLFMPGGRQGAMTAAWFAFEDVSEEAGPLIYYPGSHQIPIYRFSTGSPAHVGSEFHLYQHHMRDNVDRLALVPQKFLPKKGDVLIWHELLFHGGAPIVDPSRTRKSFVCHYWNSDLMPPDELSPWNGVYRQKRAYLG